MHFIFHAKLKRRVETYFNIKVKFIIKTDESSCQKALINLRLQIHMVCTRQVSRKLCEYFSYFDFKQSLP